MRVKQGGRARRGQRGDTEKSKTELNKQMKSSKQDEWQHKPPDDKVYGAPGQAEAQERADVF